MTPDFDGENGCLLEARPYRIPARLHGPVLTGWRRIAHRFLKWLSRRLDRRESVVVVGQARPDRH